ncbi:hypothetical protein BZG36_00994, partial [Bifiguratus adelaidae]
MSTSATETYQFTETEMRKPPAMRGKMPPLLDEPLTWSNWYKYANWLHVFILFFPPLGAIYGICTVPLQTKTLIWSIIWYFSTGLGITAGYHRLWSHRAYSATLPLKITFALTGAGAVEGSIGWWSRGHRAHHRYTDTDKDPYSAHRGVLFSHIGWMLIRRPKNRQGYADIADLKADPVVKWQHKYYLWIALTMGIVFPTVVAGLGWGDWKGGYFYAAIARLVFVHHATFCVNSLAHWLGDTTFDDKHTPRDHYFTALVTMGEGYHNFHHEFPQDYRNAIKYYQYDPTKWLIILCSWIGLAYNLKTFPHNEIVKGTIQMQEKKIADIKKILKWGKPISELPAISWDEFQSLCKNDGKQWILIEGIVYDVSKFMNDHPGGVNYIKNAIGKDMTVAFNGGVYDHSNGARNLLSTMRVAVVRGGMEVESFKANPSEPIVGIEHSIDHRGVPEAPGRVVTLIPEDEWKKMDDHHAHNPDGVTWGVAYKIPASDVATTRAYLDHREKNGYTVHAVDVYQQGKQEPVLENALVYIATLDNVAYVGPASEEAIAEQIYKSRGPSGWNGDYLFHLADAMRHIAPEAEDDHLYALEARVKQLVRDRDMAQDLGVYLRSVPGTLHPHYRLTKDCRVDIVRRLYTSLYADLPQYESLFFPGDGGIDGERAQKHLRSIVSRGQPWNLPSDERGVSGADVALDQDDGNVVLEEDDGEEDLTDVNTGQYKPCGHVFKKNEGVYRCRNCALDVTCAFCSKCFHATNHEGHDIFFSISIGSGGCCDCGDPEAWKVPIHCPFHSPAPGQIPSQAKQATPVQPFPEQLKQSIQSTVSTALDFLLETLVTSPSNIAPPDDVASVIREARMTSTAIGEPQPWINLECQAEEPQGPDSTAPYYAVVLWNDENHSFIDVILKVTSSTNCTEEEAKRIANMVDLHGREVVAISTDLAHLLDIARQIASIHLAVTVRLARDVVREQICGLIIEWLKDLTCGRHKYLTKMENGPSTLRELICAELCREWELPERMKTAFDIYRFGSQSNTNDSAIHASDELSPEGDLETDDIMDTADQLPASRFAQFRVLGLQMQLRSGLQRVGYGYPLVSPQSNTLTYLDTEIGNGYSSDVAMANYDDGEEDDAGEVSPSSDGDPDAFGEYFGNDSEWNDLEQLSPSGFSMDLSTELHQITDSPCGDFRKTLRIDWLLLLDVRLWKEIRTGLKELYIGTLVVNPDFKRILGMRFARNYTKLADAFLIKDREPEHSIMLFSVQLLTVPTVASLLVSRYDFFHTICTILINFFLTDHISSSPRYAKTPRKRRRINCESKSFKNRRYFQVFHDLKYVLGTDSVKIAVGRHPKYLNQYLDMISLFQGMNPQVRQADQHVEYETETWMNAFNVTLQLAKSCRQFSESFATSTRAIGLAVKKVLKFIDAWVMRVAEEERATATRSLTSGNLQRGVEMHTLRTTNFGDFEVLKFSVCSQPVSFHYPLHWLLAETLENVDALSKEAIQSAGWKDFRDMIFDFDSSGRASIDDRQAATKLFAIMDHTFRTIVLLAQIRCGVWVRNGFGIKSQAHHYRDIQVRENTYDADLFMLQIASAVLEPNRFLAAMLDRFDLWNWFNGKTSHENYDASQMTFMVEELLNIIVVMVCERGTACGLDAAEKIRREIVHHLCSGALGYSDLTKRISERLTDLSEFDQILAELTTFRPPDGINDHGVYELKPAYFDEVDHFFYHYTRNNREDAEAILKTRLTQNIDPSQKTSHSKCERWGEPNDKFVAPRPLRIQSGPFIYLGDLLQSGMFCHIATYALWNGRNNEKTSSDTIMDSALHLIMLALVDGNNSFQQRRGDVKGKGKEIFTDIQAQDSGSFGFIDPRTEVLPFVSNATTCEFSVIVDGLERKKMSLLRVLISFMDNAQYSSNHDKLRWILAKMKELGDATTKEVIQEYEFRTSNLSLCDDLDAAAQEAERKKKAAKERQAKIMEQFAQARAQFMEKHDDWDEDMNDDELDDMQGEQVPYLVNQDAEVDKVFSFPEGTCIVCQEETDGTGMYGLLGLVQPSRILRTTPSHNNDYLAEVLAMPESLDEHILPEKMQGPYSGIKGFPANCHQNGLYVSSCGHLMHHKCFQTYVGGLDMRQSTQHSRNHPENLEKKEFICPLCKSLGNTILPVVWRARNESYPSFLQFEHGVDDGETVPTGSVTQTVTRLERLYQDNHTAIHGQQLGSRFLPESMKGTSGPRLWNHGMDGPENLDSFKAMLHRFTDVLRINGIDLQTHMVEGKSQYLQYLRLMWTAFGYTISCVEVAYRGVKTFDSLENTASFMDSIPEQTMMLLRILSELLNAFMKTMPRPAEEDIVQRDLQSLRKLFYDHPTYSQYEIGGNVPAIISNTYRSVKPLLREDLFAFLVELMMNANDKPELPLSSMLHMVQLANITKITVGLIECLIDTKNMHSAAFAAAEANLGNDRNVKIDDATSELCARFVIFVGVNIGLPEVDIEALVKQCGPRVLYKLLSSFGLPFLRQTMILAVAKLGIAIPPVSVSNVDESASEFDRLSRLLHLPSLSQIFAATLQTKNTTPTSYSSLIRGWCRHYDEETDDSERSMTWPGVRISEIKLSSPVIYNLVQLPERLDILFEESMKRACRKCGTVPAEPAMCLFCGTFVCMQYTCCAEGSNGECNLHMKA